MERATVSAESQQTVLLVDDEPLILSSYGRTLRALKVKVLLAEGPQEGLRTLESSAVDVVIADYRMPGMNGDEFLEHVRDRWPDTVRMLNTAYADVDVVEQVVRRGGIFRFLTKPCDADKLRGAVRDALEHYKQLSERKLRSEKLSLDLHSFRKIFHSALDPMVVSDLEGNLVEVNDAFMRRTGQTRDEILSHHASLLSYWGQEHNWPEVLASIKTTGQWSGEIKHSVEDRYALFSISEVKDDKGHPFALVAVEKDVTAWKRLDHESRAAQYEVILSLAKLAEFRDPETYAHLERMRRYSRVIAAKLGEHPRYKEAIDNAYVEAIFASSPLHDVGKVGIPDAVLLKPGKLTREEWQVMQLHTTIGAEILSVAGNSLSQKTWLSMARTIALQHHEKVDGTGYPNGLKGEEIDLSARIVALADAYDAITSKRVYKDAFPHAEAQKRILESRGTHFDNDVVDVFLGAEPEFHEIRAQFVDKVNLEEGGVDLDPQHPSTVLNRIEKLLASTMAKKSA